MSIVYINRFCGGGARTKVPLYYLYYRINERRGPLFYSPTFYEIIQPCLGPGIFGHTFWGITKTVPANKKTFSLHILKQGTVEGLVLKLIDKE